MGRLLLRFICCSNTDGAGIILPEDGPPEVGIDSPAPGLGCLKSKFGCCSSPDGIPELGVDSPAPEDGGLIFRFGCGSVFGGPTSWFVVGD